MTDRRTVSSSQINSAAKADRGHQLVRKIALLSVPSGLGVISLSLLVLLSMPRFQDSSKVGVAAGLGLLLCLWVSSIVQFVTVPWAAVVLIKEIERVSTKAALVSGALFGLSLTALITMFVFGAPNR